jgi:hypothetical protein
VHAFGVLALAAQLIVRAFGAILYCAAALRLLFAACQLPLARCCQT